jgi:2,4-dienoyl-CoA reductase-like NADH-dependent reductase (Old Yellow Enzyme family)
MFALKSGRTTVGQCGFSSDAHAAAWADPVRQMQSFGAKVIFQIADGYRPGTRAMSIAEVEQLVQAFADAARRVVRIGGDGIMVHCAHGYGLSQFLSPFSNRRTDRYGGSLENRARVVVEIIREMKKVIPLNFPIVCKINGHDGIDEEVTPEICARNVQLLRKEGVELFEISTGFQNVMVLSRGLLVEGRTVRNGSKEEIARWKEILRAINPEFPFSVTSAS